MPCKLCGSEDCLSQGKFISRSCYANQIDNLKAENKSLKVENKKFYTMLSDVYWCSHQIELGTCPQCDSPFEKSVFTRSAKYNSETDQFSMSDESKQLQAENIKKNREFADTFVKVILKNHRPRKDYLRAVEFVPNVDIETLEIWEECPICLRRHTEDHADDCELAKAIWGK